MDVRVEVVVVRPGELAEEMAEEMWSFGGVSGASEARDGFVAT